MSPSALSRQISPKACCNSVREQRQAGVSDQLQGSTCLTEVTSTYTPVCHGTFCIFVDGSLEASGRLLMVECVAPYQATVEPRLGFRAGCGDLSMEGAEIVLVRGSIAHRVRVIKVEMRA